MGTCMAGKSKKKRTYLKSLGQLKVSPGTFISERLDNFNDEYEIGDMLGSGKFSTVYQCRERRSQNLRAVKIISKGALAEDQKSTVNKLQEISIMKKLDHPNILKVYQIFEDHKNFYIIMEYCSGGELFSKISKEHFFSEKEAAKVMYELLSAVTYCHELNITHRDLKPENILLDEKSDDFTIKVADFGSSVFFDMKKKLSGIYGSLFYVAPEVLTGSYNELCDEWSCGVILYVLLSGRPPFTGKSEAEILHNIRFGVLMTEGQNFDRVSDEAKDLIKQLIDRNLDTRLRAKEALNHRWIKNNKSTTLTEPNALHDVLLNLRSFNSNIKLKNAIITFISAQLVTHTETKKLQDAFMMMDKDGDGKVSQKELLVIYKEVVGGINPEKDVEEIMRNVDTDNSGYIDYTEFIQAALSHEILFSKKNLETAFRLFDKDGSGTISAQELRECLSDGRLSDDSLWEKIVGEVDQNGDGEIDLREFQEILMKKV
ncbi:unnamed protein product [Blepharisma stoltei]|uniref:non-specific serine/threonine protein kinase n=1 Tax=Blepharisma stoltei TaxID=1481888 RepID=A0AAU9IKF5_9CILI|nr:unnamed protein product [Blepharisma stoltei]